MSPSERCEVFIKQFEPFRPTLCRVKDVGWVIGYGHVDDGPSKGFTCTREEAEDWFREDMSAAGAAVARLVHVPLTKNQLIALTSFVFSVGRDRFEDSLVLMLLNEHNYDEAEQTIRSWNTDNPKLAKRRAAEADLFAKEDEADE